MPEPTGKAVFLSYASQDAEAVLRIAEALRAAGVEVWFDKDELVGGDAWDQKIRGQIAACALFVPVISATTQARLEGYFRIEWKLAAQRTHAMADEKAFLLPVVIDDTRDAEAKVPAEFRAVQWTRLPGGEGVAVERLCARVRSLLGGPDAARAILPVSPEPTGWKSRATPPVGRRVAVAAWGIAVAVVACGVGGYSWWKRSAEPAPNVAQNAGAGTRPPTMEISAPVVNEKSIAVLPFENRSEDKDAFFTEGVHDDIRTSLTNIRELHVISRSSVMEYRGTTKKISQVARELGVAFVLDGSVQRSGSTVRITSQLILAATGQQVWAKNFDKEPTATNVFAIQTEIAQAIAGELRAALSPEEKNLVGRRPTQNRAAYDLYLEGRQLRRGLWGTEMRRQAEKKLSRATELDSQFAEAWAELAECRAEMFFEEIDVSVETREAARRAMDKAQLLAPDNPVVIAATGRYLLFSARDYAGAFKQFERLAGMQPNSSDVQVALGEVLRRQGRWSEALAATRRARKLDPASADAGARLFALLQETRRYAEAEALARERAAAQPDEISPRFDLALAAYAARGSQAEMDAFVRFPFPAEKVSRAISFQKRLERARGNFAQVVELDRRQPVDPDDWGVFAQETLAALAVAHAGDLPAAQAKMRPVFETMKLQLAGDKQNSWRLAWMGLGAAMLGQREEALEYADRACELMPEANDAIYGRENALLRASVLAWNGDKDGALAEFARLLRVPHGAIVHGAARGGGSWWAQESWLPLRGDPRFEALLNDPKNNEPLF